MQYVAIHQEYHVKDQVRVGIEMVQVLLFLILLINSPNFIWKTFCVVYLFPLIFFIS
jgi:hypothetical protein